MKRCPHGVSFTHSGGCYGCSAESDPGTPAMTATPRKPRNVAPVKPWPVKTELEHKTLGCGTITAVKGGVITVKFVRHGLKEIMFCFAHRSMRITKAVKRPYHDSCYAIDRPHGCGFTAHDGWITGTVRTPQGVVDVYSEEKRSRFDFVWAGVHHIRTINRGQCAIRSQRSLTILGAKFAREVAGVGR